jgi:Uncharacterized protein conserved in bacteria
MEYEVVTLEEKIAVGICARTSNTAPDMGAVIGGLWNRFYDGIHAAIPYKANEKSLGIYTDYAGDEKSDYTVFAACETTQQPEGAYTVCRIPAGRYARFIVHGDMVQAVAKAWQEIWAMQLPRSFQCDFEEYQTDCTDNAEIHIYIGLSQEGQEEPASRCGILCGSCGYRKQMGCGGCVHITKPFWGESCPVKACCEQKHLVHCGQCGEFACDLLKQFAYDEKQGDQGKRITQCRLWSCISKNH